MGQCHGCPSGTYNDLTGDVYQPCVEARPGRKASAIEATWLSDEVPCGTHFWEAPDWMCEFMIDEDAVALISRGADQEVLCEPGWYTNVTGMSTCMQCAAGYYNTQPESRKCSKCPAGYYNDETGSTGCAQCPERHAAPAGSVTCEEC